MTAPYQAGHHISLIFGGMAYFQALERALDAAQTEIFLETYIFDFSGSGERVAHSLIRAAARGVKTYVLMDGVGTGQPPLPWQKRFDDAGVQWRVYKPTDPIGLLFPRHWRRLHRKLCVMDAGTPQAVAFCGGINILDDFHDPNHGRLPAPRFDFAVRIQGPLVLDVRTACASLWSRTRTAAPLTKPLQRVQIGLKSARHWLTQAAQTAKTAATVDAASIGASAALLLRDNVRHRKRIEQAYLKAISQAQHEIIISNAYFLPGQALRRALRTAARRGVRIRLLLQGRYEYFMQYHAARPVYADLLACGIEIHEYAVSFLHAKVAVVDACSVRAWATVGSSNLDPLSLLLAREANVAVRDQAFAKELREALNHTMDKQGQKLDAAGFASRPWQDRLLDRIAYALMRCALWITGKRY